MRRRLAVALAVIVPLVCGVAPANAKPGEGAPPAEQASLFVSGPGVDVPIVLDGRAALRLLYLTTFRAFGQYEPQPPPAASLGPGYEAWYFVPASDGELRMIRQELYPCAEGAVWAYTPTEQGPFERSSLPVQVSTGWWYSTALVSSTADWDLPCIQRRTTTAALGGGRGWGGPIPFGSLVVVGALALISLAWLGRRRRPDSERAGAELGP